MIVPSPSVDVSHTSKGSATIVEDIKLWSCVYPNYIDSLKSVKEGRRLSKSKGVERPTVQEIFEVASTLFPSLAVLEESKAYPRDWLIRGRVRINLENVGIKKNIVLEKICEILKTRKRTSRLPQTQPSGSSSSSSVSDKKKKKK